MACMSGSHGEEHLPYFSRQAFAVAIIQNPAAGMLENGTTGYIRRHGARFYMNNRTVLEAKAAEYIVRRMQTSLEADIQELSMMVPDCADRLRSLFRSAAEDAITNTLGESTAKALIFHMGDLNLNDPYVMTRLLDSFLQEGAQILKAAIMAEFREKVHATVLLSRGQPP